MMNWVYPSKIILNNNFYISTTEHGILNMINLMKIKLSIVIFILTFFTGCNENQYRNVQEIHDELQQLNLKNKDKSVAYDIMKNAKYKCKDNICYKEIPGFPCMQVIHISFQFNESGLVNNYEILNIRNNQIPTACV